MNELVSRLVSQEELVDMKLKFMTVDYLRKLAASVSIKPKRLNKGNLIEQLMGLSQHTIDSFIKDEYQAKVEERRQSISDDELIRELQQVTDFNWGVVQGRLDQKIQQEYVREICHYQNLLSGVKSKLHDDITSYVVATWYNHWTTVLIEDYISLHPEVVPTLKNISGVDIFFKGQPFDLKTTYFPRGYPRSVDEAIANPDQLAIWLYENQGEQRFGNHKRLFVILVDNNNLDQSWKLKRDFEFIFGKIDQFLNEATVSAKDKISFSYKGKSYHTFAKVLIVTK